MIISQFVSLYSVIYVIHKHRFARPSVFCCGLVLIFSFHRFHIQDFNVNALLRCIFPYHDTNIFVRALQLLQLREETNRWHWLHPLVDPGVPLSKGALAAQCAENLGFMKFLCVMNKKLIKVQQYCQCVKHYPQTWNGLYYTAYFDG